MKLYPENRHYFMLRGIDQCFRIKDIFGYMCSKDLSKVYPDRDEKHTLWFVESGNYLKEFNSNRFLCYNEGDYFLSESSDHVVTFEKYVYDKHRILKSGSYAAIYNSFNGSPTTIDKVSFDGQFVYDIPEDISEEIKDYCLIRQEKIVDEYVIERMTKGVLCTEINYGSLHNFFLAFRGLFKGLVVMKKNNFFHGDITMYNIVFVDGVLKLIDYNFSQDLRNIRETRLQNSYVHTIPYILSYCIGKAFSTSTAFDVDKESILDQRRSIKCNISSKVLVNLINSNISSSKYVDAHYEIAYAKCSTVDIYHYIDIYQLVIAMLMVARKMRLDTVKLDTFAYNVLNFDHIIEPSSTRRITTPEEALRIYDSIFS